MKREALNRLIKQTVRKLRKEQTESESLLWQELRNRKLLGKKFLRQHPIIFKWDKRTRFLIADFYCHKAKMVVELDGEIHNRQKDYDAVRDYVFESLGMKIIRIKDHEIDRGLAEVVERLKAELSTHPLYPPLLLVPREIEGSEQGVSCLMNKGGGRLCRIKKNNI